MLGASRWFAFRKVILRALIPPMLTGFALAFARAVGEYGSIVFISGNMPLQTEIVPLLIVTKLEQYQYAEATALAVVMLVGSFATLLLVNAAAGLDAAQGATMASAGPRAWSTVAPEVRRRARGPHHHRAGLRALHR